MVGEVIRKRFAVKLSKASVCRLLLQLGLTPQRPVWRAYQQKAEEVQLWLKSEYPRIRSLAKRLRAQVFFADEAGVRSDHHAGTTWAPRGRTPAVSAQGEFRFMVVPGRINAARFIEFIKRLLTNAPGMIFLIVDGHPTHRASVVQRFAKSVKDRFRLFFLPPYSPELNPDERVWNDLKNNAVGRQSTASPDELRDVVLSHLRFVQKSPDRVRSYFNSETTRYAI
jgi:transposase